MTATQNVNGQPVRSSNFYQFNDYIDELTYVTAMRNAFDQPRPAKHHWYADRYLA